jgi:hypothetical protein
MSDPNEIVVNNNNTALLCDMEKRLKEAQEALHLSQQSENKTKAALQTATDSLKDDQDRIKRAAVVLCRLNEKNDLKDLKISELERVKTNHEVEITQLKAKLQSLQNTQTMQTDIELIKMILPSLSKKLDDIEGQGKCITAKLSSMEVERSDYDNGNIGDKRKRA